MKREEACLSQDNKGSDLSDLKQRLGLNKDESESGGEQEQPEQAANADQRAAEQGGEGAPADEARYQSQQGQPQPGQQPAAGGPQGQSPQGAGPPQGGDPGPAGDEASHAGQGGGGGVHQAETRVGPPPGEQVPQGGGPQGGPGQGGPPGQGGGLGDQPSSPQGGPGLGDQASSPQGGPGLGDQPSSPHGGQGLGDQPSSPQAPNSFSETTPDNGPGAESFGPPGGGPPESGGPPGAGGPPNDHDPTTPTSGAGSGFGDTSPGPSATTDPGPEVADLDADEGLDLDESTFSTPVLVMLGIVLVIGLVFGLVLRSSMQQRRLYSMQTEQANEVLGAVEPKAKAFKEASTIIKNLDPDSVEYSKAEKLGELDVGVDMSVLSTDKLFLGGDRMAMLTSYIVKAQKLQELIEEHARQTNQVDKKDLERIVGGAEEQKEKKNKEYAAVFNFNRYKNAITQEGYTPMGGKLVTLKDPENIEDGKVRYSMPNSEREGKIDVRGIVRLSKGDMLTVGGENAFERYQRRVAEMKHLAKKMEGRSEALVQKLKELAERPGPPLISL